MAQRASITGYVTDAFSGERLIGASVFDTISKKGTVTNSFGFFSASFSKGDSIVLEISYVGYEKCYFMLRSNGNLQLKVRMCPNTTLNEVTVTANRERVPLHKRSEMSTISLPMQEAKLLPALGGESDVLKVAQLMPGIQSGSEGSSGIFVRGGTPDQNLIIFDDVPLYYVNHIGGLVSIFNSDAINDLKIIKGGFPARYGNRLSSVVDVRMKDGNYNEHRKKLMIGMVATSAFFEGPIKKDTASFMVSVRRLMYDLLTRPLSRFILKNTSAGYTFYDVNAKLNYRLSDNDALYLSLYAGDDKLTTRAFEHSTGFNMENHFQQMWGNQLAALRWNRLFGNYLFANTTIAYTRYHYGTEFSDKTNSTVSHEERSNYYLSGINDVMLKIDLEYNAGNRYRILFGLSSTHHTFRPTVQKVSQTNDNLSFDKTFGNYKLKAWEHAVYMENEIGIGDPIKLNVGLRTNCYSIDDTVFIHLEPRALLNWEIDNSRSLKASYTQMTQNLHQLTNAGTMPIVLWLPATRYLVPETSEQYALGYAVTRTIDEHEYECSVEVYYKTMHHLISYRSGFNNFPTSSEWRSSIQNDGKGVSKGIELYVGKVTGCTTGWMSCTIARNTRQFDNINGGNPYLFKYDHLIDFNVAVVHRISECLSFSASWSYGSGNAVSLPVGAYTLEDKTIYIYEGVNTFRMRAYHRLDVGLNWERMKKGQLRTWSFSIYNVYNRQNPYYYYVSDVQGSDMKAIYQQSFFPIIPSVSWKIEF